MPLKRTEYYIKYTTADNKSTVRTWKDTSRDRWTEKQKSILRQGGKIYDVGSHPYKG